MLSTKHKIFYSIGGIGENITFQAASAWLFYFWSGQGDPNKALIPIGLLGVLLGIGRLIEAFDDPLIGHLSDQTKSRWGRRFPFIFFGAPFQAITFFLLWIPLFSNPAGAQNIYNTIYFFIIVQLFFLAYTIVTSPYEGIMPEIAKTSKERVSTSAYRVLFGVVGAALGLVGSSFLISRFGFLAMGAILGTLTLLAYWISVLGIKKLLPVKLKPAPQINIYQALLATLTNKPFLIFSLALILFSLGFNLLNAMLPFYVKIILKGSEALVGIFSGLVLVSMVLALPIQTKLASKFGKKKVYAYSMLALGVIFPMLATTGLIPYGTPFIQTVLIVILIGLALSGQFIFPNALLADVIDYDAIKTGLRREAIYFAMQDTLTKFAFAISNIIFGSTLAIFGSTIDQPLGIRLIGPIAALTTILGFVIFIKGYKLPDQVK